jgi:hypothetical protein
MRFAVAVIICFFNIAILSAAVYEYPSVYKTEVGEIKEISIDCPEGSIRFEQSADNEINIRVLRVIYLENQTKAEKIAGEIKVDFRKENQVLHTIVDIPNRNSRAYDIIHNLLSGEFRNEIEILIKVAAPPNIMLNVTTASADISGRNLRNNLTLKGASSNIKWENVIGDCDIMVESGDFSGCYLDGNILFTGSSSDFDIDELKGNLSVSTSSGDVTACSIWGDIKIKSISGEIRVYDIKGDIDLNTTSGDIYSQNIDGSATAKSISGEIKLSGLTNPQGKFSLRTISGDVYLEMADNFNGGLEIETRSGEIRTDLDIDFRTVSDSYLEGKTGEGTGKINIITTSGDISMIEM